MYIDCQNSFCDSCATLISTSYSIRPVPWIARLDMRSTIHDGARTCPTGPRITVKLQVESNISLRIYTTYIYICTYIYTCFVLYLKFVTPKQVAVRRIPTEIDKINRVFLLETSEPGATGEGTPWTTHDCHCCRCATQIWESMRASSGDVIPYFLLVNLIDGRYGRFLKIKLVSWDKTSLTANSNLQIKLDYYESHNSLGVGGILSNIQLREMAATKNLLPKG